MILISRTTILVNQNFGNSYTNKDQSILTEGKSYKVVKKSEFNRYLFLIECDDKYERFYNINLFYTLDEYREMKLNEIL